MKRPKGVMDMGLFRSIVDQAVDAGATTVSIENFGEAFCDPHIFERAAYAKSKGLRTMTISNASLLNEDKCRRVVELFDTIRLSVYAVTKNTYEKIHRGLNFEDVEANVDCLFKTRKKMPSSKLKIEMYYLLMQENEGELKAWLEKYEKMANAVAVWKPHNWSDGRGYRHPQGKKVSCRRPFTGPLQVQWDGFVVPCCFDYDSRIILGDLKKETLREVFGGVKYDELRKAHDEGDFSKFPFCDGCDQLNKREDVLVYTTIKNAKVGATNTTYFKLRK